MKKEFPVGSKEGNIILGLMRLSLMIMGLNFLSYILLLTGFISSVLSGLNSPVFWSFTFFTGGCPWDPCDDSWMVRRKGCKKSGRKVSLFRQDSQRFNR